LSRWFSPGTPPSSNTKTGRHGNISDSDVKYQNSNSKFKFFKFSDEPILYIESSAPFCNLQESRIKNQEFYFFPILGPQGAYKDQHIKEHGNISDSDVKYQNSNSKFKFFKFSDEPILYIVAIEDMYPIIKQSHTAVGHAVASRVDPFVIYKNQESRIKNFIFFQFWAHKGHTKINI
jgi:hypothetical protein